MTLISFLLRNELDLFMIEMRNRPVVGAIAFIALNTAWIFCCLPSTPFEIGAGIIYGPRWWLCLLVGQTGKMSGASLSFLTGRTHACVDVQKRF